MQWLLYAVLASALWGLTYLLDERMFRSISVPTHMAIQALVTFVVMRAWSFSRATGNETWRCWPLPESF